MNNVNIAGRLTADPKINDTVANFGIALNYGDKVTFVPVVVFGNQVDIVKKYLKKGDFVAVTGRLSENEYISATGTRTKIFQVICQTLTLGGRRDVQESTD